MDIDYAKLLTFCQAEQPWQLDTLEALARIESPSVDKAAVDRCGAELARRLRDLGAHVARIPTDTAGDHLRAELDPAGAPSTPSRDRQDQILVLGHFDTVWGLGTLARMPVVRCDGRLYGPGTFDMKAGIAVAMLAVRALTRLAIPHPRIVMLWTTDEEIGSGTSRALVEAEARASRAVLVLEPSLPGGAVKTARKGVGEFVLDVTGVPAHAGIDPSRGVSAIHELATLITALAPLNDAARGTSVNVGVISGGTRTNIVAERARAQVDVRVPTTEEAARVEGMMRHLTVADPRAKLEIAGGIYRPPLERTPAVAALYDVARDVARALGQELGEGATGGGSDGNFTAALGVPTLDGLGAIGDGAHAVHEHVDIASLGWRSALVAGVIARV